MAVLAYEAVTVFDWIEQVQHLKTVTDAWRSFMTFAGRFGYSYGAIADCPRPRWRQTDNVLAVTWPDSWHKRYETGNFLRRDPSVRALAHTREPFTWEEALRFEDYQRSERNIVFEAADHGLRRGLVVPIISKRAGIAVVTISGDSGSLSSRDRAALQIAAIYAQRQIRLLAPEQRDGEDLPHLSPRERECLEWAAMGKTDWEIGEILSIAERTAGAHIERAKQKMGVATRVQAIVLALQGGAISI